MSNESHYRRLENMMHSAPLVELTGARVRIGERTAEIVMPVKPQFFHAAGALHGALYFMALDNAAFFAVNSMVDDVFVLTTSFTIYLTRPVSEGTLKAVGRVVNHTRNQYIAESVLCDAEGRELARGSGVFVRSKIQLTESIGYK
ncbi:MAG: PaaI family thioesterase [Armatimonadota bacterium]|nr:MAG: PaaI family thioesterase [Armatimonadota bacterium]